MKPAKAIFLFLAVTAPLHIARAQASFDAGEGCLNVIDVSYAQGVGEYGYPLSYLYQRSIRLGAPFSIHTIHYFFEKVRNK